MNNFTKNILAIFFILLIVILLFNAIYFSYYPEKNLNYFVDKLRDQEKIIPNEEFTPEEVQALKGCGEDFKCFKKFFYDYNLENNLQKSFSKLSYLMKYYPEFAGQCHQITHGIGNSELLRQNNDIGKAISLFINENLFKNLSTCGSGYFHGLVEEGARDIKDKDLLVNYFNNVCNQEIVKDKVGNDCIHGLGHATFIQTDYNIPDSLYVCENTTSNDYDLFNCYTGVFMEAQLSFPTDLSILQKPDGGLEYLLCNGLNSLAMSACYFEQSISLKEFVKDKRDFAAMIDLCRPIKNDVYRMACIKNLSIRSFIDAGYFDVRKMCTHDWMTFKESALCYAAFAHRLSLSVNPVKNADYFKDAYEICKNADVSVQNACKTYIFKGSQELFLTK